MVVIFGDGKFWIETLEMTIDLENAAGQYVSATFPLERAGTVVGVASVSVAGGGTGDGGQSWGQVLMLGEGSMQYGKHETGLRVRVRKQISTDGTINATFMCTVFLRKTMLT